MASPKRLPLSIRARPSESLSRWVSAARADFLLSALLPALRHSIPRGNVTVQHLLRAVGSRKAETGALGRARRPARSGQILRCKDLRGFHLEARSGLL